MSNDKKDIVKLGDTMPSNSNRKKEEHKAITPVTTGVRKKKSLGRKFADVFLGEHIENVSEYVLLDVLIPAAKDMIAEAGKGALDMFLFGGTREDRSRKGRSVSRVSYRDYYENPNGRGRPVDRPSDRLRPVKQRGHNFDDILIETRGKAEEVLGLMVEMISEYGAVSIADYYDLVGVTSDNYTDNNYGWVDLRSASVNRVRDGYLIDLPRVEVLD